MTHDCQTKIHYFDPSVVAEAEIPPLFTYPFYYTPHPLTVKAAQEVQLYLQSRNDWQKELHDGKMFGVLIIRTPDGRIGYLAAFSGNIAQNNRHAFFVPPIYDLLQPDGFFKAEEANISAINAEIDDLENLTEYRDAKRELEETEKQSNLQLANARQALKEAKILREKRRSENPDETVQAALIRESQFLKAEYKRLEKSLKEKIASKIQHVQKFEQQIQHLKQERKKRSAALQQELFKQFRIRNALGEIKDLCEIFKDTPQGVPPSGAGECALPKLLQYAYIHGLAPLAMGEFWWGMSPKNEIRHHGHFYPSCKGKCEPILKHMLKGLNVEKNPLETNLHKPNKPEIVFEDTWLLAINKPAGMLSVPGKSDICSVYQYLRAVYPEATGPLIVHRLDMATSGLMLIAKNKEVHQALQALFESRNIKKCYTAILDGEIDTDEGMISLPLCPDLQDRPRQKVDYEFGKKAVTLYKVAEKKNGKTLIYFYPQTGRTHQLRVHAAHPSGLKHPIVGDELYGKKADRLYLHATELTFKHPVTQKTLHLHSDAGFHI